MSDAFRERQVRQTSGSKEPSWDAQPTFLARLLGVTRHREGMQSSNFSRCQKPKPKFQQRSCILPIVIRCLKIKHQRVN